MQFWQLVREKGITKCEKVALCIISFIYSVFSLTWTQSGKSIDS